MGHREKLCNICGVSFSLARIRTRHEPPSAAWRSSLFWDSPTFVGEGRFCRDDGLSGPCSEETGCSFTIRFGNRGFKPTRLGFVDLTDKGEFGEKYEEETDKEWEGESEDDESLEYVSDDESSDFEMEDVAVEKEEEDMYCEDYLTLIRNLREEMDTPERQPFFSVDAYPGAPWEFFFHQVTENEGIEPSRRLHLSLGNSPVDGPSYRDKRGYTRKAAYYAEMLLNSKYYESRPMPPCAGGEHVAGPSCREELGYNGHAISAAEMKHSTTYQMLAYKRPTWNTEPEDQEWEEDSECFLTGLGDHFPIWDREDREFPDFYPTRHGFGSWGRRIGMKEIALMFHPACFDIFTRLSKQRFGKIDINGLISQLYINQRTRVPPSMDSNVKRASTTPWAHHSGSEYLAANPIYIPGLIPILEAASKFGEEFSMRKQGDSAFDSLPPREAHGRINTEDDDPFLRLPQEVRDQIVDYLSSREIAALRLGSRAFYHLPISLWYKLLEKEMPWLWEVYSSHIPSFWTALDVQHMHREENERFDFDVDLAERRKIIINELPEALEAWENNQPRFDGFDAKAMAEKEAQSVGTMLKREGTNWYALYRGVKTAALKGLRNRERIWCDVERLVQAISRSRDEGAIVD